MHLSDCVAQGEGRVRAAGTDVPRRWYTWSSDNQWVVRVDAFDRHRDTEKLITTMARMEAAKEFQFTMARDILNFASKVLGGLDPEHFPRHLLRGLIETGFKAMAEALDVPDRAFGGVAPDLIAQPEPQEEWSDDQINEALKYAHDVGLYIDLTGNIPVDEAHGDPGDIQPASTP